MPKFTADTRSNAGTGGSDATVSVQTERIGDALLITLARSSALNALTASMVDELDTVLRDGERAGLRVVVLRSASPKAFSAGGDIRVIRAHALAGDPVSSEHFFGTEYRLNHRIASYPVPFVSLVDGICMGGGMGLSVHGSFRVVTERAKLAMPETGIGFFPDVGASFFLPRLPGALGRYLGLTGAHITAADALYAGLATHYVHSTSLDELLGRLLNARDEPVDDVLNRCANTSPVAHSQLASNRGEIDWCFGTGDLDTIYNRLAASNSQWAQETRRTLAAMSPQSLHITTGLLSWGRQRTLAQCLDAELRLTRRVIYTHDFIEGVRAALVTKDRKPEWGRSAFIGYGADGGPLWSSDHETIGDAHTGRRS
jgi:enoyl-CoA hydratase/carnithine racemase